MVMYRDSIVADISLMTDKGIMALEQFSRRVMILDGQLQKLGTRKFTSVTDAINTSFPKATEFGAGGMEKAIASTTSRMEELSGATKNVGKQMSILEDQSKSIGILMGLLFGGMTVQRWGNAMVRFVLPAMEQVQGYTSEGTKKVNAMNAAFEFLKFSMFEAFTSTPLFRGFVDILINATNWLSQFVSKHPGLTTIVGILGGTLAAGGWFMQIAGGFFQFGMLWKILANTETANAANGAISGFKKSLGKISPVMWGLGAAALLFGLSLGAAYKKFPELKTEANIAFDSILKSSMSVVSSFADMFGITIDTTDALYAFGSTANTVLLLVARGVDRVANGFDYLFHGMQMGTLIKKSQELEDQYKFATFMGDTEKIKEVRSELSKIEKEMDSLNKKRIDSQSDFETNQDLLDQALEISATGMTSGKDAADKLRSQYGLLGSDTVELSSAVSDNITKTQELETASVSISEQFDSEIKKVLEAKEAYIKLAEAKANAITASRGSSLGSVRGVDMVSDGNGGFIQKKYARAQ